MPTVDQILNGLRESANTWKAVSVFWHVFFGVAVIVLPAGIRPSKRVAGVLLGLPLLSVSTIAWLSSNPFNGLIFAVVGIVFLFVSARLQPGRVRIAPALFLTPGVLMFVFGWVYPHFLNVSGYFPYLYAAPLGLIPCPTLSIVIGSLLILDGLNSRALCILLGGAGLFYGVTGVVQLHVALDWALLFGAAVILVLAFTKQGPSAQSNSAR